MHNVFYIKEIKSYITIRLSYDIKIYTTAKFFTKGSFTEIFTRVLIANYDKYLSLFYTESIGSEEK